MSNHRFKLIRTEPHGRVLHHDFVLGTRVDHPNQLVRVDLGDDPIRWVAMPRDMALELARQLLEKALQLKP